MISRLSIESFRCHEETVMNLAKVNWVVGLNREGKSSILAALEFALSSRNEWCDGRGTGLKTQIKHGKKTAGVQIFFDDGAKYHRSIPPGRGEETLPWSNDILQACLRCRYILEMPEKDQKDMFYSLLDTSAFDLWAELNAWSPQFPDLGTRFKQLVYAEGPSTDDIDQLYSYAAEERAIYRKMLKDAEAQAPAKPEAPSRTVTHKEIEAAKKQWEKAVKAHAEEAAKHGSSGAVHEAQVAEWKAKAAADSRAREELKQAEEEVSQAATVPDQGIPQKEITFAHADITEVQKQIDAVQKEADKLHKEDKCPAGKCLKADLKALNTSLKGLQEKKSALQAKLQQIISKNNEAQIAREKFQAAEKRLEKAKAAVDALPELGEMPVQVNNDTRKADELQKQVDTFWQSYQSMDKDFRRSQAILEWEKAEKGRLNNLEELREKVAMLICLAGDRGVNGALAPGGLKTKVLQDGLIRIQELANRHLEPFDIAIEFQAEPWLITADGTPVAQLSGSEKTMVSLALQTIVAEVHELNLIGVDEHRMNTSLRGKLLDYLLEQTVQSVCVSTLDDRDDEGNIITPEDPCIPGLKVFLVKNGRVHDTSEPEPIPKPPGQNGIENAPGYAEGMAAYIAAGGRLD